jgi:hypothetical protein
VSLETVGQCLLNQRITVGEKENPLCPEAAHEDVDQAHSRSCLASPSRHDQERAPLVAGKRFPDPADGFVLVAAIYDRIVDGSLDEWLSVLANETQPLEVAKGEDFQSPRPPIDSGAPRG